MPFPTALPGGGAACRAAVAARVVVHIVFGSVRVQRVAVAVGLGVTGRGIVAGAAAAVALDHMWRVNRDRPASKRGLYF